MSDKTFDLGDYVEVKDRIRIFYELYPAGRLVTEEVTITSALPKPYVMVIQHPVTTASGVCVGGAVYPVTAAYYGWIQSGGPGAALIAGTPAVGQPVTSTSSTAGSLAVHSAELSNVAYMMKTGRSGKVLPVYWLVDG